MGNCRKRGLKKYNQTVLPPPPTPKKCKCCANVISKPFIFICNPSLPSGIYAERSTFAIVQPIHNNGDKTKMTNWRPISLSIPFSKIFETLMFNRLNQYLQTNKILYPKQLEKAIFTLTHFKKTVLLWNSCRKCPPASNISYKWEVKGYYITRKL
jgi:hypothetical protein